MLASFQAALKAHWVALVLGILIGIISIAPYVYFAVSEPSYAGISLMGQDAEEHYLARIHEAYEGNMGMGNSYLPYKKVPYLIPPLGEDLEALAAKIFHISVTQVNIAAKFVLPFCVFLLIYTLGYLLCSSRAGALLGGVGAMFTEQLLSQPISIIELFKGHILADGIYWSRPINPEISGLLLYGSLILLWLLFTTEQTTVKRSVGKIIALGLLAGASLYISPYPWSFIGATMLLVCGYLIYKKEYRRALAIVCAGVIALTCAVPFVFNFVQARAMPGYAAASMQHGVLGSHAPVVGLILPLLLLAAFLGFAGNAKVKRFFILLGVALLFVLNQQILTGFYLQPGHYHWYITKPLFGLIAGLTGISLVKRFSKSVHIVSATAFVGIALLLGYGALAQVHFYRVHAPASVAAQSYAPILAYLASIPGHQVVFADSVLSDYIPIYTPADAPADVYAPYYIAPLGYFEKLAALKSALAGSSTQPMTESYARDLTRDLGITLLIEDTVSQRWDIRYLKYLKHVSTIGNRFEIYSVSN